MVLYAKIDSTRKDGPLNGPIFKDHSLTPFTKTILSTVPYAKIDSISKGHALNYPMYTDCSVIPFTLNFTTISIQI
uniref:Uncharacterized protein n=1 Tax=Arion vulgaris TaxID=1028688 RepID=A0A0B7AMA6_9EUPU